MGGDTSPDQQYSLRWNDYHSTIVSTFRNLRDEEDFVDVTLACDGCSFTAHKVVLSACSPYFRKLLKANPCQHPIVIIRDVAQRDMENILRYMYNGEVHIGREQLQNFLKTAQMLQVRGLADLETKAQAQESSDHKTNSLLPWTNERREPTLERSPVPAKRSRKEDQENQGTYTPDRGRSPSRGNGDTQESLLGQALEGGPTIHTPQKGNSESSLQAQSTGDDSSSDTQMSDPDRDPKTEAGDYPLLDEHHPFNTNGGGLIDQSRAQFPSALLNLTGLPALLPGPSSLHSSSDGYGGSRRSMEMIRVRATDPRPCPKCGKIYRSAHTLRTHLEDKHTICPGYRCVLCGTVAKSRNSLHSHMSRQHRGISTKDLPVVPMPAPFDPDLASRLLAKVGVKVTPAELRARASPTGPRRSDVKLDMKSAYSGGVSEAGSSICEENDPEDLSTSHNRQSMDFTMSPPLNHVSSPLIKMAKNNSSVQALTAKSVESLHNLTKEPSYSVGMPPVMSNSLNPMGSALIDTYLQYISDNTLNLPPEQLQALQVQAARLQLGIGMESRMLEKMQQMDMMKQKHNDEITRGDNDIVNDDLEKDLKEEALSSGGEEDDYSDEEQPQAVKAE